MQQKLSLLSFLEDFQPFCLKLNKKRKKCLKHIDCLKIQIIKFIICMYSRVRQDGTKYALPNGMATSSLQVKELKQKLLKNYYENHTQTNQYPYSSSKGLASQASRSGSFEKIDNNTLQKQKILSEYDTQTMMAKQQKRDSLTNDLIAQMEYKQLKKQYQKHQNLSQQANLIRYVDKFEALQKEKMKQFNNKYKMEAQQDLQFKQMKKINELNREQNEKNYLNNHFTSRIQRSTSMGNIQRQHSYSNPTKQYYHEIQQAIRARNEVSAYNPEIFKRNSSFKITNNEDRAKKIDNMYASSLNQHYSSHNQAIQKVRQQQARQKEDLKQVLLRQIKEKQKHRTSERRVEFQTPYTTNFYKNVHHPINNPVDFKSAHDNHYMLKELKSIG